MKKKQFSLFENEVNSQALTSLYKHSKQDLVSAWNAISEEMRSFEPVRLCIGLAAIRNNSIGEFSEIFDSFNKQTNPYVPTREG